MCGFCVKYHSTVATNCHFVVYILLRRKRRLYYKYSSFRLVLFIHSYIINSTFDIGSHFSPFYAGYGLFFYSVQCLSFPVWIGKPVYVGEPKSNFFKIWTAYTNMIETPYHFSALFNTGLLWLHLSLGFSGTKISGWAYIQLMHALFNLFIHIELLSISWLLEVSIHMIIMLCKVRWICRMWKTLKMRIINLLSLRKSFVRL